MRIRLPALLSALALAGVAMAAPMTSTTPLTPKARAATFPYQDPTLPVATRVDDLLSRMSLDEKIGQMTQAERASVSASDITNSRLGSVLSGGGSAPSPNNATSWANMYDGFQNAALATPLGIPILYGADAVHGHNNVVGATIFPHNIGLGATRNPSLVQDIGRATAEEVAGTGVNWDFAPCVCVARNDRWGRTYESFGEKPDLPSSMTSIITGLQGTTLGAGPASVLATAKHYVGDGGTTGGVDQGDTQLSETDLRAIHLPPFQAAVQRGVGSVMISFSSWNGAKMHGNQHLITDVLKGELGFTGFVVSDWDGVNQIDGATGMSATDVRTAINAGIDMVMAPADWQTFINLLRTEVQAGRVPMSRIDDANRRILTKKFQLGLFEHPLTDRSFTSSVGSAAHRSIARTAVAQSQVLLKNAGNVLPLARDNNKIFVAGKNADNIGNQSGGWTISWQGGSGTTTPGTSILQGIRNTVGSSSTVTFNQNGSGIDSSYKVAIAVVGETPYAEGQGDRPGGMGLDSADINTINTLRAAGVPVVVVLVSGRPLDIASQLPNWNALVASWLPGTEGQGVADVLFGAVQPTGKLPVTWPSSASQEPINDGDGQTPLFAYGFGLTYGTQPPPADTTAPTAPGTPTAAGVTSSSVNLSWAASTDNVGVTGYDVVRIQNGTETAVTSATTTSAALTGLTAGTSYTFAVYAKDAAGNRSARSGTVAVTTAPGSGSAPCRVNYAVNDWGGGFTGNVTITNAGSAAVGGWTLKFAFPGNQQVSQGWEGTWSQSGNQVTAVNAAWNGTINAGASVTIGFNASYSGGNPAPTAFTLNGSACSVA
ncbi:MAG TPA: glycoside hydrolase family 3 N-terminal domain-containing protein [Streptosporangiaceae bacterium]